MKRLVVLLCLAFAFPTGFAQAARRAHATIGPPIGVAALMRDAGKHKGPVLVEGVVAKVFPRAQKLGVIDTVEFRRCGVVTCAEEMLPVRWKGAMPEPKALVRMEGEVQKGPAGFEFVARSVETVRPARASQ